MDIAAELQQEATERAGSPEGFLEVIRLVLDSMEEEQEVAPLSFGENVRPEWMWPEQYLPTFREYVCLMQEVLALRRRASGLSWDIAAKPTRDKRDEFVAMQKKLSDLTHTARRKARELPIHAYKRLKAIESRLAPRVGGADNIYHPNNWGNVAAGVEWYISNFGVAREDKIKFDAKRDDQMYPQRFYGLDGE